MKAQKQIGTFIKNLRERKGITQKEFAQALKTSQSAVARMEKGEQNFTTELLDKVSNVLDHDIFSVNGSIDFEVHGGKKLFGSIKTNFSKNGSVGLLCAALVNQGTTTLHGIARIEEVYRVIEILESIGVVIKWQSQNTLTIKPPKKFNIRGINRESAIKTRSIIMLLGPLIHFLPEFYLPHAFGCNLGKRTIAAHTYALDSIGVKVKTTNTSYQVKVNKKLKSAHIVMYEPGDTACENILTAASLIPGKTTINFASSNYMVQEVCFFLEKLGVKIDGIGTGTMTIHGLKSINKDIEYSNSEDPIESMMFISLGIATHSKLKIERCPIDFLSVELEKLKRMGLRFKISRKYFSYNDRTSLVDIEIFPSRLNALEDKIHSNPYPGINIDNLPFFVPIATQAKGQTLIHDWVYENRAIYFTELNRLGANINLADPHRVYITGLPPSVATCYGNSNSHACRRRNFNTTKCIYDK
jgi:UDP-N-acetylglucosamine 1-carboxyvinyltransferase